MKNIHRPDLSIQLERFITLRTHMWLTSNIEKLNKSGELNGVRVCYSVIGFGFGLYTILQVKSFDVNLARLKQ